MDYQVLSNRVYESSSDQYINTARKIQDFRNYKRGWHYGEGIPVEEDTILIALDILQQYRLSPIDKTDAFLGLDGDIRVAAYKDNIHIETTIFDQDHIDFHVERLNTESDDDELISMEALSIDKVKAQFERAVNDLWNSLGLLVKGSGNATVNALLAKRSAVVQVFPFSASNALEQNPGESAATYRDSMEPWTPSLIYAGS